MKATRWANIDTDLERFTIRRVGSIAGSGLEIGWKAKECYTMPVAR